MYLPKSQYIGNLYSNGEFAYEDDPINPYFGYYFKTKTNILYTGRYPGDGKNLKLALFIPAANVGVEAEEDVTRTGVVPIPENSVYFDLIGITEITIPTPFYPKPTPSDYETGEFIRYFAKKANENLYTETSDFFENVMYMGISLPWLLVGDKDKVYETNRNMVLLKEQQLRISGFGDYLKHNYLKFYSDKYQTSIPSVIKPIESSFVSLKSSNSKFASVAPQTTQNSQNSQNSSNSSNSSESPESSNSSNSLNPEYSGETLNPHITPISYDGISVNSSSVIQPLDAQPEPYDVNYFAPRFNLQYDTIGRINFQLPPTLGPDSFSYTLIDDDTELAATWASFSTSPLGGGQHRPDKNWYRYDQTFRMTVDPNYYQSVASSARSATLTLTLLPTNESVTFQVTQPATSAADDTPLDLQLVSSIANSGDPQIRYTTAALAANYNELYYDMTYSNWEVTLTDPLTSTTPTWVGLASPIVRQGFVSSDHVYTYLTFDLVFDTNTTGAKRYYDITITELTRNESISSTGYQAA